MNLFAVTTIAILTFSASAFADTKQEMVKTPYTLNGLKSSCTMTVLEIGTESIAKKRPGKNPHWKFYADVSIDAMPDTIYHLKSRDGKSYWGHDGNSGTRLKVRKGASIQSPVPFSHGSYSLYKSRTKTLACHNLRLSK